MLCQRQQNADRRSQTPQDPPSLKCGYICGLISYRRANRWEYVQIASIMPVLQVCGIICTAEIGQNASGSETMFRNCLSSCRTPPPLQDETYAIGPSYNGEASQWHSCCHMSSELNRSWHRFHAGVAVQAVLWDGVQARCMNSIEKEG